MQCAAVCCSVSSFGRATLERSIVCKNTCSRQNFLTVRSRLHFQCKITVELTFENFEQLRETAEEEVAGLSIKLQTLERERREAVARLETEVAEQKADMAAAAAKNQTQMLAAEQRTKDKDLSLRRLQKQVAPKP